MMETILTEAYVTGLVKAALREVIREELAHPVPRIVAHASEQIPAYATHIRVFWGAPHFHLEEALREIWARAAELERERCAMVCDDIAHRRESSRPRTAEARECAEQIRKGLDVSI